MASRNCRVSSARSTGSSFPTVQASDVLDQSPRPDMDASVRPGARALLRFEGPQDPVAG